MKALLIIISLLSKALMGMQDRSINTYRGYIQNSNVNSIPATFQDFFAVTPHEVCTQICSYIIPLPLLNALSVSEKEHDLSCPEYDGTNIDDIVIEHYKQKKPDISNFLIKANLYKDKGWTDIRSERYRILMHPEMWLEDKIGAFINQRACEKHVMLYAQQSLALSLTPVGNHRELEVIHMPPFAKSIPLVKGIRVFDKSATIGINENETEALICEKKSDNKSYKHVYRLQLFDEKIYERIPLGAFFKFLCMLRSSYDDRCQEYSAARSYLISWHAKNKNKK